MTNGFTAGWPDERVDMLRKFAEQKMSGSQISKALGVTRSAVLGKAMRLGIKIDSGEWGMRRPKGPRGQPKPLSEVRWTPSRAPFPGVQVNGSGKHASDCRAREGRASGHTTRRSGEVGTAAASLVRPSDAALNPRLITIHELRERDCRWPIGDPSEETFRYCGAERSGPVSYCPAHCRMAYQPRGGA